MSIKFFCQCGKRLRARDEMAGRRSMCPRCGSPVGIPSLQPTHPGRLLGPMTLEERLKARRRWKPDSASDSDAATGIQLPAEISEPPLQTPHVPAAGIPRSPTSLVRLAFSRKDTANRCRGLETHWFHSLLFPLRALLLIVLLSGSLTLLTGFALGVVLETELNPDLLVFGLLFGTSLVFFSTVVASYACGFLDCTFAAAAAGEPPTVRWPGRNSLLALKSLATWVACFLAGPIVPAGIFFLYWSQCGDPELIDWLIWAELVVVAIGYWLLAIVAVSVRDRLRDANPIQIVALVRRVGFRLLVAALVAALVFLGYSVLALNAIELLHKEFSGLLLLAGYWFSALFIATFLFRLLGVWCYQGGVSAESEKNV